MGSGRQDINLKESFFFHLLSLQIFFFQQHMGRQGHLLFVLCGVAQRFLHTCFLYTWKKDNQLSRLAVTHRQMQCLQWAGALPSIHTFHVTLLTPGQGGGRHRQAPVFSALSTPKWKLLCSYGLWAISANPPQSLQLEKLLECEVLGEWLRCEAG